MLSVGFIKEVLTRNAEGERTDTESNSEIKAGSELLQLVYWDSTIQVTILWSIRIVQISGQFLKGKDRLRDE